MDKSPAPPRSASSSALLAAMSKDRGLWLYNLATLIGAPIFLHHKWRVHRHLNADAEFDIQRWRMRFAAQHKPQATHPRETSGPRIVFVAMALGDVMTAAPLVRALREARPDVRVVFSVKHHEAIAPAAQLSDEAVLPLPFDTPLSVARWHERARPDLVVFYERFWFATLLRSLWLQRVPLMIVHARMRRSQSRSKPNVAFKKWQLRGLRDILIATPEYLPGVQQLTPDSAQARVVGSIKFPDAPPAIATETEREVRAWIRMGAGEAPVLVAGSTHPSEEEFVLEAFEQTRRATETKPVLLLAPRDIKRADEVAALIEARGLSVARRSDASTTGADVLLLDTLGELVIAYKEAIGTFVGGTTIRGFSHNVVEPLVWSKPVAYGPRRGNFEVEQMLAEAAGVGFRVEAPADLAKHWTNLLQSADLCDELARKIEALISEQRVAFERTLQVLIEAVDEIAGANHAR